LGSPMFVICPGKVYSQIVSIYVHIYFYVMALFPSNSNTNTNDLVRQLCTVV
jgi:hypothetical protein